MFLNLPIELQHFVYDKLHIKDRKNLNIALVRNKIMKSIDKDKKLAVICYAFKHKDKYNPIKSDNIMNFIKLNHDEPTIKQIIEDYNLTLEMTNVSKLENMIQNNDVSDIDKLEDIDLLDICTKSKIKNCIARYAKPDTFDAVFNKYILISLDIHLLSDIFLDSLNYKNFELFKHLAKTQEYKDCIEYITTPYICNIFTSRIECLEVILQNITLPENTISYLKAKAIDRLNLKTLELLKKYNLI